MIYPKSIATLIEHFQKFPSIGPKSAQRMAFYLLRMPMSEVQKFASAMIEAKENTRACEICFNISTESPCEICTSTKRDRSVICVVGETKDLIAIEKTNEYKGLYHVLHFLICIYLMIILALSNFSVTRLFATLRMTLPARLSFTIPRSVPPRTPRYCREG